MKKVSKANLKRLKAGKSIIPTEHAEQCAYFAWRQVVVATGLIPEMEFAHAIPNGGRRGWKTAKDMKAEGVTPGVPDIFIPAPRFMFAGMYIEMKRQKGSRVDPYQKRFIEYLKGQNYRVGVAKGFHEARQMTLAYFGIEEAEATAAEHEFHTRHGRFLHGQ